MTPREAADRAKMTVERETPPGFELFGFCPLEGLSRLLDCRGRDGARALSDAGGWAVMFAVPYYAGPAAGSNIARYAWADDYHRILPHLLAPAAAALAAELDCGTAGPYTDVTPLPEVEAAVSAGLGFRGRSGRLITREYGTETFICEILVGRELSPIRPAVPSGCGECRLCAEACPTGALSGEGLTRERCISHITQKKGVLTHWEEDAVRRSGSAWGCDRCSRVCPYNRGIPVTPVKELAENLHPTVSAEELDALLPVKSYGWRGRAVMERNLALIKRPGESEKT